MKFYTDYPTFDCVEHRLKELKMTNRELSKLMFGDDTRRDIVSYLRQKKNPNVQTLVRVSQLLGLDMNCYFEEFHPDNLEISDEIETMTVEKMRSLKEVEQENRELKALLSEKDARINDLNRITTNLAGLLDKAMNTDGAFSDSLKK